MHQLVGLVVGMCLFISANSFAQTEDNAPMPTDAASSAATTASTPASTGANSYACTMNNLKRSVSVEYEASGAKTPCKVNYAKDSEAPGATQVLYSATAEAGYCEKKIVEFVEKLQSNGWTCSAQ